MGYSVFSAQILEIYSVSFMYRLYPDNQIEYIQITSRSVESTFWINETKKVTETATGSYSFL